MSKAIEINERIKAACEAMDFGSDYAEFLTPNLQTEQQAETFASATMRITREMETRDGVAWVGILTVNGIKIEVQNDGHGGCHTYYCKDVNARRNVEAFAEAIYSDDYGTPMDQFVDAVEMMSAVAA